MAAIAVAGALGTAAVCLVVFGVSQKQLQLGILLGLWSALLGAFLIFGERGDGSAADPAAGLEQARAQAAELHEAQLKVVAQQQEQLEAARQAYFSSEIELRQFGEQQLARDADARRESEQKMQAALRREIERVLVDQLGSLREEVAALRAEVVDKLGGQLRLERIETTRVIGSDLEALQHEIRRLAASRTDGLAVPADAGRDGMGTQSASAEAARDGASRIVDAELVEFPPPATALPQVARPEPVRSEPTRPEPVRSESTRPEPVRSEPAPFAGLPRLSPLPEDLDLISGAQDSDAEERAGRRRAPDPERMADDARYQGRRRADGDPAGWFAR